MSSGFSGALQITSLDDFITPSQECIKPVEIKKKSSTKLGSKIKIDDDGTYLELNQQGLESKLEKVEITLADCLACSGCITSAESVLVTQQSQEELLKIFKEKKEKIQLGEESKFIVVSLSIQPILSLAEKYCLKPEQAAMKIAKYFRSLGADMVLDMVLAENFSLIESAKEFVERYKTRNDNKNQLPMLASSCPGWICYAEKTHGNFILPYISVTKSPQQIMGSLVKYHLSQLKGKSPEQVYHITVMPCYDKKLEAYREDFYDKSRDIREVDCVITSIEIEQMLSQENKVLQDFDDCEIDKPFHLFDEKISQNILQGHIGSGSGGYADFIFQYAAKHLFLENDVKLEYTNLRNPDFKETVLKKNGEVVLKFAIANGFRNIQNLVQKLKRGKSAYDYVEVMACPSGCLNGGAQIRPTDGSQPRELAFKLEHQYESLPKSDPENDEELTGLYKTWLHDDSSDKAFAFLHTQYHEIEKMSSALSMRW